MRYLIAEGAAVWPEIQATLAETAWIHDNVDPSIPPSRSPQPHILNAARSRLHEADHIEPSTARLNGRDVTAWMPTGIPYGERTTANRTAMSKRRDYRSFIGWTGNPRLCGTIAEQVVHASLLDLTGQYVWLPPDNAKPGHVRQLLGRPLPEQLGPFDAAGHWPLDPHNPGHGFVPFAVEVKNVRAWLYPWDHEVWDLLAKVAVFQTSEVARDLPPIVPVLIARRIHPTTFRMFSDVGALGEQMRKQWFAPQGTSKAPLDPDNFDRITTRFSFRDATRAPVEPPPPQSSIRTWFRSMPSKGDVVVRQQERWRRVAPIAARYQTLRDDRYTLERSDAWREFVRSMRQQHLIEKGGWAATDA